MGDAIKVSGWRGPLPDATLPEYRPFWDAAKDGVLKLPSCGACHRFHWYPQVRCPHCRSYNIQWKKVEGRGRVFSWTIVRRPFHPDYRAELPITVALVELDEAGGIRLISRLVEMGQGTPRIGMPVEVVFEQAGDGVVLPVFRPIEVAKEPIASAASW